MNIRSILKLALLGLWPLPLAAHADFDPEVTKTPIIATTSSNPLFPALRSGQRLFQRPSPPQLQVANADAVALRVADGQTAASIYRQIVAFPAIRPFDFLLTNARAWTTPTGTGARLNHWRVFDSLATTAFYEQAVLRMYNGFAKRMANYVENRAMRDKSGLQRVRRAQK